jgi:sulfonate transport system permease protein
MTTTTSSDTSKSGTSSSDIEVIVAAASRRVKRRKLTHLALGIAVPVALLLLWEAASRFSWIDPQTFPSPTRVLEKLWHALSGSGTVERNGQVLDDAPIYGIFGSPPPTLWDLIWATTQRVLVGFVVGSVTGIAAGVLMGTIRVVRSALEPLFNALYTVPKLALTPVFFGLWGVRTELPMYAVTSITTFFFVWISTMAAITAVPFAYREAAASYGLKRWGLFRNVLWPASLPDIAVGLRIAAGVTVLLVLGAELLVGANGQGIGVMIFVSKDLVLYDQMYVGILIAALMGVVFTALVGAITKRLVPWTKVARTIRPT